MGARLARAVDGRDGGDVVHRLDLRSPAPARARELKVAHPLRLRAIAGAKKKTDAIDEATRADRLRCGLLSECYMTPPATLWTRRGERGENGSEW